MNWSTSLSLFLPVLSVSSLKLHRDTNLGLDINVPTQTQLRQNPFLIKRSIAGTNTSTTQQYLRFFIQAKLKSKTTLKLAYFETQILENIKN